MAAYLPAAAYVFEISTNGDYSFPFVSAACADIYGFTPEAAMADASLMHEAIHPEDKASFDRAGQRSAQQLRPVHWEGRLRRPDGAVRHISISSKPRRVAGATQWHGVVIDRTAAHEREMDARLELVRRNQHQGDLLAMASHDIGTPLASVLGYAEEALSILDEHHDSTSAQHSHGADLRHSLHRIIQGAHRIDALRRDLLITEMAESGRIDAAPRSVLVRPSLITAVESVPGGPDVRIACPVDLRCHVQPNHLDRMLVNLISNAGRFARTEVTVRAQTSGATTTTIAVTDDGPGVPDEFVDRLFDRFTRAASPQGSGTGLGLFITRHLAEANGGSVRYEPVPSGGASFCIELPRDGESA